MASDRELVELYGALRAQILSRHFAFSRYYRANLLSLENELGQFEPVSPGQRSECGTEWKAVRRPPDAAEPDDRTWQLQAEVAWDQSSPRDDWHDPHLRRWLIADRVRENPLLYTGPLFLCMGIEHHLGLTQFGSRDIVLAGLKALRTLYKWPGGPYRGWIVRWDAVTNDAWKARTETDGAVVPELNCSFLPDFARNTYHYCVPFSHPLYEPHYAGFDMGKPPADTLSPEYLRWYRRQRSVGWRLAEVSQDELCGLVTAYDAAHRFFPEDVEIQALVKEQVSWLAEYLSHTSYLLVRPLGGLNLRGATEGMPALAWPFMRVFDRILGDPHPPKADFKSAMQEAGYWHALQDGWDLAPWAGAVGLGLLVGLAPVTLVLGGVALAAWALAGVTPVNLARTMARAALVHSMKAQFDLQNDGQAQAVVSAYALMDAFDTPRERFVFAMDWVMPSAGSWFGTFPVFFGITALGDPDPTVRDKIITYFERDWLRGKIIKSKDGRAYNRGLAAGTATVLGAPSGLATLREALDAYAQLLGSAGPLPPSSGIPLAAVDFNDPHERVETRRQPGRQSQLRLRLGHRKEGDAEQDFLREDPLESLDFMVACALGWLQAKRLTDAGTSVPPELPAPWREAGAWPPTASQWPAPTVPATLAGQADPAMEAFLAAAGVRPGTGAGGPLGTHGPRPPQPVAASFVGAGAEKPAEAPAQPPAYAQIVDKLVAVPKATTLSTTTGIWLMPGDSVSLTPFGTITADRVGAQPSGPSGWWVDHHPDLPANRALTGAPWNNPESWLYALMYRIGSVTPWKRLAAPMDVPIDFPFAQYGLQELQFRVNDNHASGAGAFTVQVVARYVQSRGS